ncbi:M20/M25/M40 family metallo-hydrolase [Haliea sp. E1-2-M8]|uniref:M20/M25/M40 family metallo-hydrolase n=1 Tax=Haliea sp. E1-2-M8 TaxID=3064706 RepID=UPI00271F7960|nr:M20/M25/M40 family metallo-hydrolase [Haliea sp. E1-2-M8]MDO8863741.1 M20/M25/M40 family metallo-hydrolase [Haliea sp. E1-2-M8]
MKKLLWHLTIALVVLSARPALSALSNSEERMADFIDRTNPAALELLIESVNLNSGTMNLAGVRKVGELFSAEFAALDFDVEWVDGAPFERAGHLLARYRGSDAQVKVLLIGHLDTVFEPDSPFQTFTRVDGDNATGPGIADMKGGNVIMLRALAALRDAGALEQLDVTVVLTGDEELSGSPLALSKQALVEAARYADLAIGFENGDGDYRTANVARRGSSGWSLSVSGTPAHSSQVFREDIGSGAIYEAARILYSFHEDEALRGEQYLTFNPGRIAGGTTLRNNEADNTTSAFGKSNVVAESARVEGDIRALSAEQLARAQARMAEIVAENLPGTSASIRFDEGYPPMAPAPGNLRLLELYSQVSEDLGFGAVTAVNPLRAGAADISFAADYVEMAIDGLGMSGTEGHTVHETGYLPALPMQAKRAALLLHRLAGGQR